MLPISRPFISALLFPCILLFSTSLTAQIELTSSEMLEEQRAFEEDDIILYRMDIRYEFDYDRSTGLVEVEEKSGLHFINLTNSSKPLQIPLFGDDYSVVTKLRVNSRKHSIKTDPYDHEGIFHSDANFVMLQTNVDKGYLTTFVEYDYHYTDSKYLTRIQFSRPYPIKSGSVSFHFPDDMDIDVPAFNIEGVGISRSDMAEKGKKVITYTITDLPAYRFEQQSSGSASYMPHALVLTRSVTTGDGRLRLLTDASDLYKWYATLVKGIGNEPGDLEQRTSEIVEGCEDKECEMRRIFYWVQDNIRYIAFEDGLAGFRPEACQDVYSKKYGDCKGMANLMAEMLKTRGIDARLTWIGTNSIPYDYDLPSLAVDNHMICTVVDDGRYIFLDGTEKFISYGDIAERIQGRQAMVENGEGYEIVDVPHFDFGRNTETTDIVYKVENGELIGQIDYSVQGEGKVRMMNQYRRFKQRDKGDAKAWFFTKGDTDISVDLRKTTELDDRELAVDWGADFRAKNKVNTFGDELYLDWDIYRSYGRSDIEEDELKKLKGDMDFGSKVHDVERYTIEQVEGYRIKSLPSDFERISEHFKISVDFESTPAGDINITKEFVIPQARIPNTELGDWNQAIIDLNKELYDTPIIYEIED